MAGACVTTQPAIMDHVVCDVPILHDGPEAVAGACVTTHPEVMDHAVCDVSPLQKTPSSSNPVAPDNDKWDKCYHLPISILEKNKQMREEKKKQTIEVLAKLAARTFVTEMMLSDDVLATDVVLQKSHKAATLIGDAIHTHITFVKVVTVDTTGSCHTLSDDCLSSHERQIVYKGRPGPPSSNSQHYIRRFPQADGSEPTGLIITFNACCDIVFILCQNGLDSYWTSQRNEIKTRLAEEIAQGWNGTCGFSGVINAGPVTEMIQTSRCGRLSMFGGNEQHFSKRVEVKITKNGSGTTARAHYRNYQKPGAKTASFQLGNHLKRAVRKSGCRKLKKNKYIHFCANVLSKVGDLFMWPEDHIAGNRSKQHKAPTMKDCTYANCKLAVNHSVHGTPTPWSIHYDAAVCGPTLVSAERDPRYGKLSSLLRCDSADAGEFWHEVGCLTYALGSSDFYIFNGLHMHTPYQPSPLCKKGRAGRYSLGVFRYK